MVYSISVFRLGTARRADMPAGKRRAHERMESCLDTGLVIGIRLGYRATGIDASRTPDLWRRTLGPEPSASGAEFT
ncbi:MAG TPA: hypothetical protein PKC22_10010 [Rhodocyclaceae bacterium]|nr:hypothetical protein [Rhodocyclaceae bacterium]